MIWINMKQLLVYHSAILQESGGEDGIRDRNSLEAVLAAPMQTFGGQELFPGELEKIARLGYGLAANHAFVDGNKRIGAMVTQLLLRWNGYRLSLREGELADMFYSIADGTASQQDLLLWLKSHLQAPENPR